MVNIFVVAIVSILAGYLLMVITEWGRKSDWGWMPYLILWIVYPILIGGAILVSVLIL